MDPLREELPKELLPQDADLPELPEQEPSLLDVAGGPPALDLPEMSTLEPIEPIAAEAPEPLPDLPGIETDLPDLPDFQTAIQDIQDKLPDLEQLTLPDLRHAEDAGPSSLLQEEEMYLPQEDINAEGLPATSHFEHEIEPIESPELHREMADFEALPDMPEMSEEVRQEELESMEDLPDTGTRELEAQTQNQQDPSLGLLSKIADGIEALLRQGRGEEQGSGSNPPAPVQSRDLFDNSFFHFGK